MIDIIRDCNAPGNGLSADAAFKLAYQKVNEGVSNVINIEGSHGMLQGIPVVDFLNESSALTLQGHGSQSVILPQHVGPYEFPFRFGNLESFTCKDLYFASTSQDKKVDCGPLMLLGHCPQASFVNTHLVGLAGYVMPHLGLLYLYHCDSTLSHCSFTGCGVGNKAAVIVVEGWIGFHATHVRFIDFGRINKQGFSKTPWAGSKAWISFTGKAIGNDDSEVRQGMYNGSIPLIENSYFDEGAGTAISFAPDPAGPRARGLIVKRCGINVNGVGVYAQHADHLVLEDDFFAWNISAGKAVVTQDVRHVRMVRCKTINGSRTVEASGDLESFIMEDCEGFTDIRVPKEKLTIIKGGRILSSPVNYEFARFPIPVVANPLDPAEIYTLLNSIGDQGYSQCYVVVGARQFRCLRPQNWTTKFQWKDWRWVNGDAERDKLTTEIGNEGYGNIFAWQGSLWASKPKP